MKRVRYQPEAIRYVPIDKFHEHKSQVDSEEHSDLPCVFIFDACLDKVEHEGVGTEAQVQLQTLQAQDLLHIVIEEKQVASCEEGVQDYSQGGELHEDQESETDIHDWDVRDSAYYMVVYGFKR